MSKKSVIDRQVIKSEAEMLLALRDFYCGPEYVFLPQVPNGTGGHKSRTADGLAMSVWPSRGLYLVGIEVKVSRSDWLRELHNPKKADDIGKFCDYWMIAAGDENIVQDGELPLGWGLLVPGKEPGKLRQKSASQKIDAQPITRAFLAGLLRGAFATVVPFGEVDAEIQRRVAKELETREETMRKNILQDLDRGRLLEENTKLKAITKAMAESIGVYSVHDVKEIQRYAAALKLLRWAGLRQWIDIAEKDLKKLAGDIRELRDALPKEDQPSEDQAA